MEDKEKKRKEKEERNRDPLREKRESELIRKVCEIFMQREISFYDAFQNVYDPLAKKIDNTVQISVFK